MPANPDCPHCQGTGWREVQRGGLVAVKRCDCAPQLEPEKRLDQTGVPDKFRRASFDNFSCGSQADNPIRFNHLSEVFTTVKAFVREYPVTTKRGLLLYGPTGTGKTHLAVSALKALIERGFEATFFDYQTLLQMIRDGYNVAAGASDRAAYRAALDAEILLLDDLGAHRATDWVFDTVTSIITHRYNSNRAVIATTNLPIPGENESLRYRDAESGQYRVKDSLSDRVGDRAVSRLFEMCRLVRVETDDYRRRLT
jgi:DNA replication protein DnaC